MPDPRPLLCGWLKEGDDPWHVAVRAATERECWAALLASPAPRIEALVNRGRHPDERRRPR